MLIGIALDRDSSNDKYRPTFHVHCLCIKKGYLTLSLLRYPDEILNTLPRYIHMRDHANQYREVASAMAAHSPLPLSRNLTLVEVLEAYDEYLETPGGIFAALSHYHEMILLAAVFGESDIATSILNRCLAQVAHSKFRFFGGREEFVSLMISQIEAPSAIHEIVEHEASTLKVDCLPQSALHLS
ncbi:MAG: hypothetical protein H6813_07765 [Phycisphaeraceae bacterium]|nr:hypothetical protein [Phycisphaeraceae bacterium]